MFDIKRSFETYLVSRLNTAIDGLQFYPSKGVTQEGSDALAGKIDPPFGIVSVNAAQEILTGSNVYTLDGVVCIISHLQDTPSSSQSQWVKQTKDLLDLINNESPRSPGGFDLMIHGIDIAFNRQTQSQEDMAHADTLAFTAGATSLDQLTPLR